MGPGNDVLATRLGMLKGTQLESRMITPEIAQAAGFDPTKSLSKSSVQKASPFGRASFVYGTKSFSP